MCYNITESSFFMLSYSQLFGLYVYKVSYFYLASEGSRIISNFDKHRFLRKNCPNSHVVKVCALVPKNLAISFAIFLNYT